MTEQISLDYGYQTFAIFVCTLIISFAVVLVFAKKKSSERIVVPKKIRVTILLLLGVFTYIVVANPQLVSDVSDLLGQISQNAVDKGFFEVGIYAGILGVVPAIIFLWSFRSEDLTSGFVFDQKILLKVTIILFVMELMVFAVAPLLEFIGGTVAFLAHSELENFKLHELAFLNISDFIVEHLTIAPIFLSFLNWIPIAFLIFVIHEIRSSHLNMRMKVALSFLGIIPIVILQTPRELSLLFPTSRLDDYLSIFIGPIISVLLLSFLATGGYVNAIRENIGKFKRRPDASEVHLDIPEFQSLSVSKIFVIKFTSIFFLIINIIGLCRNLFLVTIPFVNYDFPIGLSMINGIFINSVSNYAINTIGQSYTGATLVYNSFTMFFSFFWMYDIIMTFKGFREEYLNSENTVYKTIRRIIGPLAATSFLGLIVLFMVNNTLTDFRSSELNTLMPNWVQSELNLQNNLPDVLSQFTSHIDFTGGLATVAGVIYLIIRSKKRLRK